MYYKINYSFLEEIISCIFMSTLLNKCQCLEKRLTQASSGQFKKMPLHRGRQVADINSTALFSTLATTSIIIAQLPILGRCVVSRYFSMKDESSSDIFYERFLTFIFNEMTSRYFSIKRDKQVYTFKYHNIATCHSRSLNKNFAKI